MFGKLKDKLKSWFSESKETIEETAEKIEEKVDESLSKPDEEELEKERQEKEEQTKKDKKIEKEVEKIEKLIEDNKKQPSEKIPTKFDVAKRKFEPDLKKIEEEAETLKKETDKAKKIEKETKEKEELEKREEKEVEEKVLKKELAELKEERKSILSKIKSSLSYKITEKEFDSIFNELEMLLLENNVALEVVEDIQKKLSEKLIGKEIKEEDLEIEIKKELKNTLNEILIEPDNPLEFIKHKKEKPFVILFFGINGTGKTTSIAKITHFLKKSKISVVLAAADTFRAASIEQLSEHAKNLDAHLIKQNYNSDPSAVGFDAIKYAKSHSMDVVIIDTAGRIHTKANLLSEMEKICRVTKPDLKIFVAESIAGNDATEQAKKFNEAIGIDGSILTKADIDEKGGTIISVSHATKKPIFYLGTGQNYEDLELFNKQKFIENLLE